MQDKIKQTDYIIKTKNMMESENKSTKFYLEFKVPKQSPQTCQFTNMFEVIVLGAKQTPDLIHCEMHCDVIFMHCEMHRAWA